MSDILVVPPVTAAPVIGITEEGTRLRNDLLARAEVYQSIVNVESRDAAISVAGKIRAHLKEIEANRVEVLRPFHDVVKAINRAAADHAKQLSVELKRVNGLVGEFEDNRIKELQMEQMRLANAPDLETTLDAEEKVEAAASIPKPTGGFVRRDWDIEVTDLKSLYMAYPQCVKLEPQLLAIKDLLKVGITPPGVTAKPKVGYSTRAAR